MLLVAIPFCNFAVIAEINDDDIVQKCFGVQILCLNINFHWPENPLLKFNFWVEWIWEGWGLGLAHSYKILGKPKIYFIGVYL